MSGPFGSGYADAYDLLYADKDYEGECDLVEEVFRRHGADAVRSLLDLGCGTGGHALPLQRRGYSVTGVDRSPGMLEIGRRKASEEDLDVEFVEGDVRTLDLGRAFDAVLLLFAVLGYQRENADVAATLATARRHLRLGGLLLLDAWYGPAVLSDPPVAGEKTVPAGTSELRRRSSATLDTRRHLCTVRYVLQREGADTEETHIVRYFFPLELELFLEAAGFEPVLLAPFGSVDGEPDTTTRSVFVVARAR